jgi:hypothetical protein
MLNNKKLSSRIGRITYLNEILIKEFDGRKKNA